MIDRSIQPEVGVLKSIDFVAPKTQSIEGIEWIIMNDVPNETCRFDLYFDAGKIRGEGATASLVNGLLLSGNEKKSSIEIQEELNALGAFHESGISVENSVITVYCLKEHFTPLFKTLIEAIQTVEFLPKEVDELVSDRIQKLKISQEKVNFLAQQAFREELFASDPNYARKIDLEDYANTQAQDLIDFHRKYYLNGLQRVVIVGDLNNREIETAQQICQKFNSSEESNFTSELENRSGEVRVPKKDALQTAIRVGKTLFNKSHPDYLKFLVLNTILGDYFGSRLMSNIREDKGYTYGIGSTLAELNETGYFMIGTEVGSDVADAALLEIKIEIERLQNELVPEEELELVKNYMMGQLLKSADGPYAMTDLFLGVHIHGKGLDFYNEAIETIENITTQDIQELAKTYLKWDEMSVVLAG